MHDDNNKLSQALTLLTSEIAKCREQSKNQFDWFKTRASLVTKEDLAASEARIIAAVGTPDAAELKKATTDLAASEAPLEAAVKTNQP